MPNFEYSEFRADEVLGGENFTHRTAAGDMPMRAENQWDGLNQLGAEGWEAVSRLAMSPGPNQAWARVFLKREVVAAPEEPAAPFVG